MSPRVFAYDELRIDRRVAPMLASRMAVALRGVVLELDSESVQVAALEQSAELADWVMWLTRRKVVHMKLVSKETFSRLVDELGVT